MGEMIAGSDTKSRSGSSRLCPWEPSEFSGTTLIVQRGRSPRGAMVNRGPVQCIPLTLKVPPLPKGVGDVGLVK